MRTNRELGVKHTCPPLSLQLPSPRTPRSSMSKNFAGNYPIEHRQGEIERLHAQGSSLARDARTMLDLIGVAPGWACLDIGCGPRGITDLMAERVGPSGRVVGLDKDEGFLAYAAAH